MMSKCLIVHNSFDFYVFLPQSCGTEKFGETFRLAGGRSISQDEGLCVRLRDYDQIFNDLPELIEQHNWNSILLGKKIAYSGGASYAIYNAITPNKVVFAPSPVMLMKAQKNQVMYDSLDQ